MAGIRPDYKEWGIENQALGDRVESALDVLRPPRRPQTSRYGLGSLILMMAMAFIAYALSLNPM
jgi:hypothetical protein